MFYPSRVWIVLLVFHLGYDDDDDDDDDVSLVLKHKATHI
jgi:hypothetical protein